MQLLSVCTHSLFLCAHEPVCAILLGARDLALCLVNYRTTSLPGGGETEYRQSGTLNKELSRLTPLDDASLIFIN